MRRKERRRVMRMMSDWDFEAVAESSIYKREFETREL